MEVGKSISKSITEAMSGDLDSAMLHACNAIDGTAAKVYPALGVGARFTTLLRQDYDSVLEPMVPGINLAETVFPVQLPNPSGPGGRPDFADIIYAIHRCNQGHGAPLPAGFELVPDTREDVYRTTMKTEKDQTGNWGVRFSDRTIFGMLAVALLSPANTNQRLLGSCHLTYGSFTGDIHVRLDNNWWGRAADFAAITAMEQNRQRLTLDFSNVMPPLVRPRPQRRRKRPRSRTRQPGNQRATTPRA